MAHGRVPTTSGLLTSGGKRVPNKALGQHWLKDRLILEAIADSIPLSSDDTVLEIGPGLGTLTRVLLARVSHVIAVEYDTLLAQKLPMQFPGKNLTVVNADFLTFNLGSVQTNYKIVANVPYYITQKILEHVLDSENRPAMMTLLVQKEVAEKLAAKPGEMSVIAVKLQRLYKVTLGDEIGKEWFTPPPKVDSQIVVCKKQHVDKIAYSDMKTFERVVRAGFSAPRKKLRTSLAGGLGIDKVLAEQLLQKAGIDANNRPEKLSVADWERLAGILSI